MKTVMFAPTTVLARVQTAFITITRDLVQPDLTLTFAMFSTAGIDRPVTANIKLVFTVNISNCMMHVV